MIATTRPEMSVNEPTLYVAFELGQQEWKLAMTSGFGVAVWVRTVAGGDLVAVERVLRDGRRRFGLPASARVVSCYEAGRDGFWIHRALTQRGLTNRVVDSASIEVNRRARRAKTDRLDAVKLVQMLVRVCLGEQRVWSEVRVPSAAEEAARQVSRERTALTQERTRLVNQLRGWLMTWGCRLPARRGAQWWTRVRDWAGAALPTEVQARLARADARLAGLETQIREIEGLQQRAVQATAPTSAVRHLIQLKGVATTSAAVLLDRGAGVAGVPQPAGDWRAPGLCADAVYQRRLGAGARDQSRGERAPAGRQHSAGLELGALATAQPAHPVVSAHLCERETGAADWDRGGGAQTGDRPLALRHHRGGPDRGDPESRVGWHSSGRVSRVLRVRCALGRSPRPPRRRYRSARVREETAQSQGAAHLVRALG
jgi:transposase